MPTASLFSESLRHQESLDVARQRLAAATHIAQNYQEIRLPALAAAAARVAEHRRARRQFHILAQTLPSD